MELAVWRKHRHPPNLFAPLEVIRQAGNTPTVHALPVRFQCRLSFPRPAVLGVGTRQRPIVL
jgi:hypothetical protein